MKKILTSIIAVLSVIGYGVFVFAAQLPDGTTPPSGGFVAGGDTVLDPGCAPGSADCIVRQPWAYDYATHALTSTGSNIGINIATPEYSLDVEGDISFTTITGQGLAATIQGDLTNFSGSTLGHVQLVTSQMFDKVGIARLDYNNGFPTYSVDVSDVVGTAGTSLNLWSPGQPSSVNQLFSLQAAVPLNPDHSAGYEAQNDPDGLKAKMYYATPLTNLSVVEVGINGIGLYSQDHTQNMFLGNAPGGFSGLSVSIPTVSLNSDSVISQFWQGDLAPLGYGGDQGYLLSIADQSNTKAGYFVMDYNSGNPQLSFGGGDADSSGNFSASPDSVGIGFNTNSANSDGNGTPLVIQVADENTRGGGFSARSRNSIYPYAGADMFVWDQALGGDRTGIWMDETKIDSGLMLDPVIPGARNYTTNTISEMSFEYHASDPTASNNSKYIINSDFTWSKPSTLGSVMTLSGSTGNLGVGVTALNDKLEVFGDIRVGTSLSNGCLKDFSGGTITGTCSSDERLKTNIQPVTNILDKLSQVSLVTYEWNDVARQRGFTNGVQQLGVLAQNVESVFPELVVSDKDGYKQVNYARLNLLNLEAIRELNVKVQSFEKVLDLTSRAFIGEEARVKRLCLTGDDGSQTCITKNQLDQLLNTSSSQTGTGQLSQPESGSTSTVPTSNPDTISDPENSQENQPENTTPETTEIGDQVNQSETETGNTSDQQSVL